MKNKKDWFKLKRYPHIGLPLKHSDRHKWIQHYVTSDALVAKHSFLPFIHKTATVRKYRKAYDLDDGKPKEKLKFDGKPLRQSGSKKRQLFYASHLDSLIYGYYAKLLSDAYERKITSQEYQLDEVICAYRSIPIDKNTKKGANKCNIDFANDAFKYISNYPNNDFVAITFDIESFFDCLNHTYLRKIWMEVINSPDKLPPAHFNVYKNITRFSFIDIIDLFETFKDQLITRKTNKFGQPLEIKRKRIDRIKYLRNHDVIAFCTEREFFKHKKKLLQNSKYKKMANGSIAYRNFGIPQGSPISSVLANIYLLHFDKLINQFARANGGIYRRYSDDMIIVCPKHCKQEIISLVNKEIIEAKLTIQSDKTQIFHFTRNEGKLICGQEFEQTINWDKNLVYLGFEFDGQSVRIKSASISGYYRKMKRSIGTAKYFANHPANQDKGVVYKRRIFKRYSYKGAKRYRKYIWNEKANKFLKSDSYNWGNFLSYAFKAASIMDNNKIRNQTKRHWAILNRLLK